MTEPGKKRKKRNTFYKYCIVPCCASSTVKTPEKLFFSVPKKTDARKRWCAAMKRDERKNKKLSVKTALYCCEDHFSLKDDLYNYMQHELMGNLKRHILKPDVVPHLFECQKRTVLAPERSLFLKRKRIALVQEAISEIKVEPALSPQLIEKETSLLPDMDQQENEPMFVDKVVQAETRKVFRSKRMSAKKKRGGGWTEEGMAQALTAIKDGMPLIRASKKFNIPRRTLRNHVASGKTSKKLGCTPVLTSEQEIELCSRIARLADAGMPLTSQLLRRSVGAFCVELSTTHRFKDDVASRKWLYLFLKRHPEISEIIAEASNTARTTKLNRLIVSDYFDRLKKLLIDYELMDKPEKIFNVGEKICNLALPYQHQELAGKKSEEATIVGCGNAIGNSIPPMILLKSEHYKLGCINNLPIGTAVEMTEKGCMTADIFSKWVLHFAKFKPPGNVLLIFDGTKSHLDVNICKAADEHDILLLCLPGNCTQELQPLDKAVFKSFESYWDEEIRKYWVTNSENSIFRFGEIFFKAWIKSMTPDNIVAGFEETGIFPFDFTIIPEVAFTTSSSTGDSVPDIYNRDVKIEIKHEALEND